MIKMRPTKKNLRGILDDPELFRKDCKLRPIKRSQGLSSKQKAVLSLIEQGTNPMDAVHQIYITDDPEGKLEAMVGKNKVFKDALEIALDHAEDVAFRNKHLTPKKETKTMDILDDAEFSVEESLKNWKAMFKIAQEQKNLNAMVSIQSNIDKIINSQEQWLKNSQRNKTVFTQDIEHSKDDSWKDEMEPLIRMFQSRGIDIGQSNKAASKVARKPKVKTRKPYPRMVEVPRELNPIPKIQFALEEGVTEV